MTADVVPDFEEEHERLKKKLKIFEDVIESKNLLQRTRDRLAGKEKQFSELEDKLDKSEDELVCLQTNIKAKRAELETRSIEHERGVEDTINGSDPKANADKMAKLEAEIGRTKEKVSLLELELEIEKSGVKIEHQKASNENMRDLVNTLHDETDVLRAEVGSREDKHLLFLRVFPQYSKK